MIRVAADNPQFFFAFFPQFFLGESAHVAPLDPLGWRCLTAHAPPSSPVDFCSFFRPRAVVLCAFSRRGGRQGLSKPSPYYVFVSAPANAMFSFPPPSPDIQTRPHVCYQKSLHCFSDFFRVLLTVLYFFFTEGEGRTRFLIRFFLPSLTLLLSLSSPLFGE